MKRILIFLLLISSIASAQKTSDLPLYNGAGIDSAAFNGYINNTNRKIYGKDISNTSKSFDYKVEKVGSTVHAHGRSGLASYSGTDAYTVIQAAINALTPAGARGSGGGKIHIAKGTYTLTNELQIIGWEGVAASNWDPYSQLIIEGEGRSTVLYCNAAGKNTLLIKNDASIGLYNIKLEAGSSARSALRLDAGGAQGEISVFGAHLDNVYLKGASGSYPAFFGENFFDLKIGYLNVVNLAGDGIIFHNNSSSTLYGNSEAGFIRVQASTSAPYSGIKFTSTEGANYRSIDLMNFNNFHCVSGYYGIHIVDGSNLTFDMVDIEYGTYGIYINGGTYARNNKFGSGLVSASNTAIYCGTSAGANYFRCELGGSGTTIPIEDNQNFMPPNEYDVTLTSTLNPALIDLNNTAASRTKLTYRDANNARTYTTLPENTTVDDLTMTGTPTAPTASVNTNTTQVATTAFVIAQRTGTHTLSNKTISGSNNTLSDIPQSAITGLSTAFPSQILVSNVALSNTGNTTENTVYTGTIPANSVGVNGSFHIVMMISSTNNVNAKTVRVKFNGTTVATSDMASTAFRKNIISIHNRNSLTSQVSGAHDSQAQLGTGTSSIPRATYSFNTGADITVTITIQNANAADTTSLEAFQLIRYF